MLTANNMAKIEYRGRQAYCLENEHCRVTVLVEGGHIAEFLDKATGVNPLWTPPWPSMEPSQFNAARDTQYGTDAEAKLLAGIMGHNLCLDLFGGPSPEEAAAGITVHGEASVNAYEVSESGDELRIGTTLVGAQLRFSRTLHLHGRDLALRESVENLSSTDRPIAWTQHVTMGPPFVTPGRTTLALTATRSKTYEAAFGDNFAIGQEFVWPKAPTPGGMTLDLRTYTDSEQSAGFTTHLMDPETELSSFTMFDPASQVSFGYRWRRTDFPWCGIWEENRYRTSPPWKGKTITRGLEFGVSPMPESRRQMIDRGTLFGVPAFRWIPARSTVNAAYEARIRSGDQASALWD